MARERRRWNHWLSPAKARVLERHAVAQRHQAQVDEREAPEPGQPERHDRVADHGDQQRWHQHGAVAPLVDQPAGDRTFQSSLGAGDGEDQVGLGLADAQLVADRNDQDAEAPKENAAGKEGHHRRDGHHPPAVVNSPAGRLLARYGCGAVCDCHWLDPAGAQKFNPASQFTRGEPAGSAHNDGQFTRSPWQGQTSPAAMQGNRIQISGVGNTARGNSRR